MGEHKRSAPRVGESEGVALLLRLFREAGLAVEANVPLDVAGRRVILDGYDPASRTGFEYLTTEAGDRAAFTPEVVAALEARMEAGELYLLLLDEEGVDARGLEAAARLFLERVARARSGQP